MTLRAAVIGLGRMGAEPSARLTNKIPEGWLPISHIEALQSLSEIDLIALCDADQNKVERFTNLYDIKKGYTDFKKMLSEVKPDFLSIATRTSIRKEIISDAVANGIKYIYAEKPLCNSVKEAQEIMQLLAKHDIRLAYGVNRRYHYLYRKAKQLVAKGVIGQLKEIHIENGYSNTMWTHPHSADLLLFFSDTTELAYIQGKCNFASTYQANDTLIDEDPYIEHAYIKFKNGIQGIINNASGTDVRLCGTKGNLTIHGDGKFISCFKGEGYFYDTSFIHEEQHSSATMNAIHELVTCRDEPPPILPHEIIGGLFILTGIIQSSLNNGVLLHSDEINSDIVITGKLGSLYA